MALKQIKNKISATKKTGKVTKAMEAVSAVKMRKSQERAFAGKPYAEAALRVLHHMSQSRVAEQFMRAQAGSAKTHCYIVITSDKGLAGNLNSSVLKSVTADMGAYQKSDIRVIAFGKKAVEHFTREGYTIDESFMNIDDNIDIKDMEEVVKTVFDRFVAGTYASVSVAFQNFVSTFEQRATIRQVLPLNPSSLEAMVMDIVPKKGLWSETKLETGNIVYAIEPSEEEVMHVLVPLLIRIMVYHAMLEHKASEHSARMVAMKSATDKANEMTHALTLAFNKERQSVITAEVSEITGGIEAMKE